MKLVLTFSEAALLEELLTDAKMTIESYDEAVENEQYDEERWDAFCGTNRLSGSLAEFVKVWGNTG